ncbi:MSMEG_0565 family glycosyltransferase [Methylobacter sp. S3L5C]|uniref:MSMEG_0565 family glycosyltransferase n=1 Tax=Methylobacter sp. S3L5C TaxID=2839024 RepID=UPI001FABFAF9|nr:MSMEG_0565 family glycosyltransferase [Methylobacter sp. S3L5C]UOA07121.1 MSMEG_0565 family glycosyltransferase [Methylobacter sp. S3L5C]
MSSLRIAMLTHSTNPRGGVVHALELAEALYLRGQKITLMAADEPGKQFFRAIQCPASVISVPALSGDFITRVGQRIQAYIDYFSKPNIPAYDIYHAQDAISGCALATLVERGILASFVRTVHHLDSFESQTLMAWQTRSFKEAQQVLCVSRGWYKNLANDYGINAIQVNNGVDTLRFNSVLQPDDQILLSRLGLDCGGPLFLAVGGIEARKNTLRIFTAFCVVLKQLPRAQLIIVGGASLLDHGQYRDQFDKAVADSGIEVGSGKSLVLTGPLPDQDMPPLFRLADALVFPSLAEGFGLVVLEAIVSGTPVIVSRQEPFTEYLQMQDCLWVDPEDSDAIAVAMLQALTAFPNAGLQACAQRLSDEFSWENSAHTHLNIYHSLTTPRGVTHA